MKKLLLIEDDPIMGKIYTDRFSQSGYDVELATDGETGLSASGRFKPNIIVLNYLLPDLTGAEVLTRLRAKAETKLLPVVVLTKARAPETTSAARKAGATKCLVKDQATDRELQKAVREALAEATRPAPEVSSDPPEIPVPPPPPPPAPVSAPAAAASAPATPTPRVEAVRGASGDRWIALGRLKILAQSLLQTENAAQRHRLVRELLQETLTMAKIVPTAGTNLLGMMVSALLALLQELSAGPENINASSMRTVFQTVDFLGLLFKQPGKEYQGESGLFNILAVDDAAVARRAVLQALAAVQLTAEAAKGPLEALEFVKTNSYHLFILDLNMPEMNGFELCEKLRALPALAKTPVIFVTACNDFQNRLRFAQSKADDFIAKPFLLTELAVKALRHLLNARMKASTAKRASSGVFLSYKGEKE